MADPVKPNIFIATTMDEISRKLGILVDTNNKILKELTDERDQGEYLRREGTASTTLTTFDILGILGFPVKGYEIHNDGDNNILFAHNLTPSLIDPNIDTSNVRFSTLLVSDNIRFVYNRKIVRNIYLITTTGTSDFRLWLIW